MGFTLGWDAEDRIKTFNPSSSGASDGDVCDAYSDGAI
jgi:hypothetical protein